MPFLYWVFFPLSSHSFIRLLSIFLRPCVVFIAVSLNANLSSNLIWNTLGEIDATISWCLSASLMTLLFFFHFPRTCFADRIHTNVLIWNSVIRSCVLRISLVQRKYFYENFKKKKSVFKRWMCSKNNDDFVVAASETSSAPHTTIRHVANKLDYFYYCQWKSDQWKVS